MTNGGGKGRSNALDFDGCAIEKNVRSSRDVYGLNPDDGQTNMPSPARWFPKRFSLLDKGIRAVNAQIGSPSLAGVNCSDH